MKNYITVQHGWTQKEWVKKRKKFQFRIFFKEKKISAEDAFKSLSEISKSDFLEEEEYAAESSQKSSNSLKPLSGISISHLFEKKEYAAENNQQSSDEGSISELPKKKEFTGENVCRASEDEFKKKYSQLKLVNCYRTMSLFWIYPSEITSHWMIVNSYRVILWCKNFWQRKHFSGWE